MTDQHRYYVLDSSDVVIQVSTALHETMGRFLGHSLWESMPRAELIFRPYFEEARQTGREVEFIAFYGGGTTRLRIVPSGRALTVHPTRLSELNVRTLGTLVASLRQIEAELAVQARAPLDLRAHGSPQALP